MAAPSPSTATAPGTTHLDLEHDLALALAHEPQFSSSSSSHPPPQRPLEMTDLEPSAAAAEGNPQASHPLDDVAIPETSPLTSLFPPSSSAPVDGDLAGSAGAAATSGHTISAAAGPAPPAEQQQEAAATITSPATGGISTQSQPVATTTTTTTAAAPAPTTTTTTDSIAPAPTSPASPGDKEVPALVITLLLTSGARHPYRIDERYLTKRNVNIPGTTETGRKDPFSISVYTLKELILREWREEWEPQPSSPSSIRLIYFGRLLDDKAVLKECRFNHEATNVIHMTVRPQDMVDEEDAAKGKSLGRDRGDGEGTAGCRCVVL